MLYLMNNVESTIFLKQFHNFRSQVVIGFKPVIDICVESTNDSLSHKISCEINCSINIVDIALLMFTL